MLTVFRGIQSVDDDYTGDGTANFIVGMALSMALKTPITYHTCAMLVLYIQHPPDHNSLTLATH